MEIKSGTRRQYKVPSGEFSRALKCTGKQMAEVVIRGVDRFGLRDNIISIYFDIAEFNT